MQAPENEPREMSAASEPNQDADPNRVTNPSLRHQLKLRTRALHHEAETTGFIVDMLKGRATRLGYTIYLRNLLPAYVALESALRHLPGSSPLASLAKGEVYRSDALKADFAELMRDAQSPAIPILPVATLYADRVIACARENAAALAGHAYVRYLGDLSGGQILKRLLSRSLGLGENCLSFYEFPGIADIAMFKASYLAAIEAAASTPTNTACVIDEAEAAFRLNIDLSLAVKEACGTLRA